MGACCVDVTKQLGLQGYLAPDSSPVGALHVLLPDMIQTVFAHISTVSTPLRPA